MKADPKEHARLLGAAKTAGFKGLKTECDRVKAAAQSRETEAANDERIFRERSLRHRKLDDGSGRIEINGPLDQTAQVMAALVPIEKELFEANRTANHRVEPEAVAFDAIVTMARESMNGATSIHTTRDRSASRPESRTSRPAATVHVHVSYDAYLRGYTIPGEICEIEGAGPISVAAARQLASDSIMKAIIMNAVDVTLISHLGRTIPAHLRTAIEVRDRTCVIAGCEIDRHLEIDHNIPVEASGLTSLENLGRLCHHHHREKTRRDLRRVGPLGRQQLVTRADHARAGP